MDYDYASCIRPIGGMTMLSLLEAYLKQARGTLHDVVKIIKEESKRPPPQKQGKKASECVHEDIWAGYTNQG